MPRAHLIALATLFAASPLTAQQATGRVSGTVRDSIGHTTLGGATVQLFGEVAGTRIARTAFADSAGAFTLDSLPDGTFTLGFFHPLLDSLGVEAPLREVRVAGGRAAPVALSTPAPDKLRAAVCGPPTASDLNGAIIGVVRDAKSGDGVSDATVTVFWNELTLTAGSMQRRMAQQSARPRENGWFALCNIPGSGQLGLRATRAADSTDVLDLTMPTGALMHQPLFVGTSRLVAAPVVAGDTTRRPARRTGDGRLTGVVVGAQGQPLTNAVVGIVDGAQTRTNQRGEWTLAGLPTGTRTVEARAVGHYPERRGEHVISSATPVRFTLNDFKAVLDTIRVTAGLLGADRGGFEERAKASGAGRFLDASQLERRSGTTLTDALRMVSGLSVTTVDGINVLTMRATIASFVPGSSAEGSCVPNVYFDGQHIGNPTADEIDDLISRDRVKGIEVYIDNVPPQFQYGMSGCGSLVIWSKPRGMK